MKAIMCDLCGEAIQGDYKEVFHSTTEILPNELCMGHQDICLNCWKAITQVRRIPVVKFPNKEVEDEEKKK